MEVGHSSGMFKHDMEPMFLVPCLCRIQLEKHGGLQTVNPQACFTKRREGNPKTHTHAFALRLVGCTESNTRFEPSLTATCRRRPLDGGLIRLLPRMQCTYE